MKGFLNIPFWNCHMKWTLKIYDIPFRHFFFSNPDKGHCAKNENICLAGIIYGLIPKQWLLICSIDGFTYKSYC